MTAIQARSATPPIPGGTAGQRASGSWWIYILLVLGVLLMVGPFLWMLLGSLKPQAEFLVTTPTFLPKAATTDNYQRLFSQRSTGIRGQIAVEFRQRPRPVILRQGELLAAQNPVNDDGQPA